MENTFDRPLGGSLSVLGEKKYPTYFYLLVAQTSGCIFQGFWRWFLHLFLWFLRKGQCR